MKHLILGAFAFLPLLATAGGPPPSEQVAITISVVHAGKEETTQSIADLRGSAARVAKRTSLEYVKEIKTAEAGLPVIVTDSVHEGISVAVRPIAIVDDQVIAMVEVNESHVVAIDKITVQGQTVELPTTTGGDALTSAKLKFGSFTDVSVGARNVQSPYQVRVKANRL